MRGVPRNRRRIRRGTVTGSRGIVRCVNAVRPPSVSPLPLPAAISSLRGERAEGIKHPAVALARSLRSEAGRAAAGLYIIHGPVLLRRALEAGAAVALVLYTPRLLVGPDGATVADVFRRHSIPHGVI